VAREPKKIGVTGMNTPTNHPVFNEEMLTLTDEGILINGNKLTSRW